MVESLSNKKNISQKLNENPDFKEKNFILEFILFGDNQIQSIKIDNLERSQNGIILMGSGNDSQLGKFTLKGEIKRDDKFYIIMEVTGDSHSNRLLVCDVHQKNFKGQWAYTGKMSHYEEEFEALGDCVIRPQNDNNYRLILNENTQGMDALDASIKPMADLSQVQCKCFRKLVKQTANSVALQQENFFCRTCLVNKPSEYYSCKAYDENNQCKFLMCKDCVLCILFFDKMKLVSRIRTAYQNDKTWTVYMDYVMTIFRTLQSSFVSVELRKTHLYKWFEVYTLDEDTFQFKLLDEIELYIDKSIFGSGNFHDVQLAKQRRQFTKRKLQDNSIELKEEMLDIPKEWVIKQVKKYDHLQEVPLDIAKQYIALQMANAFNEVLEQVFTAETIFLKYVQPYMAVPLYHQDTPYVYELEAYQASSDNIKFDNFNRPRGDRFSTVTEDHVGSVRLPHCFSHWTYAATGGNFMVTDVQGWRLGRGKYLMTDPIIFSSVRNQLGVIDWGKDGMKRWMDNHTCNTICKGIKMEKNEALIQKLNTYLAKFKSKEIQEILYNLQIIACV